MIVLYAHKQLEVVICVNQIIFWRVRMEAKLMKVAQIARQELRKEVNVFLIFYDYYIRILIMETSLNKKLLK